MQITLKLGNQGVVVKKVNIETFAELEQEAKTFATEVGLDVNKIYLRGSLSVHMV